MSNCLIMEAAWPHLLVIDDDVRLRELVARYLASRGFRITLAGDADSARARLGVMNFDLIILDVMMPGESGIEFLKNRQPDMVTPILLLTAMGEPADRIRGLENGADDYLTKPFEPRELELRARALLKRTIVAEPATALRFGPLLFDRARQTLRDGDRFIPLTSAESALLGLLANRCGAILTREDMAAGGITDVNARTIDVQVARLRRKIEPDPKYPRYLQTVRGRGYVLQPD